MDKHERPNQEAIHSPTAHQTLQSTGLTSSLPIPLLIPPTRLTLPPLQMGSFQAMEESAKTPSKVSSSEDNKDQGTRKDSQVEFSEDEETLIARMFSLVGERWDLIAGRIPGRSAEEIKKYWTKHA